jgi:hypothetical protein
MPTVIDSLILELGIDASKFSKGQRDALDAFKKTQEEAVKGGKAVEEQSRKSMNALGGIKTQALELFAAFAGGVGLKEFITGTIHAGSQLGRLSRAIGVSVTDISRWQAVAQEFGSTGENMAGAFKSLSDVFTAWQVGGPEAPQIMQIFRVINTEAERLDANNAKTIDGTKGVSAAMKSLADNLKIIHDLNKDPNTAAYLAGKIPGMDAGLFDLLITGSDNVTAALGRVVGMTQKEADTAGELDRRWNHLIVTATRWGQSNLLKTLETDTQDLKTAAGWIDKLFGTHLSDSFAASSVNNSRTSIGAAAPSGAFASNAQKESFIRSESIKRGLDPDVMVKVAKSEGFDKFLGDNGTSGGAFQLHVTPGGRGNAVGDQFRSKTGLDPLNPANEGRSIQFALDDIRAHGLSAYHGAGRVGLDQWAGGAGRGGSSTTMEFNGPITISGVQNPTDFTNKLRDLGLKRQAEANQSSVGGE